MIFSIRNERESASTYFSFILYNRCSKKRKGGGRKEGKGRGSSSSQLLQLSPQDKRAFKKRARERRTMIIMAGKKNGYE